MITLHESNITSFPLDNGIGVLRDAIIAYAEEEINSIFEFHMEYDSEGFLVDELKEERIIKAKAQDKLGYQLFRIYSITKNHENDNLIVNAQHITYDLANNFVEELKANRLTKKQVMEKIGASTVNPHPFNVTSSNTSTVSSTLLYRTNPLQMIAGMEGSVLQIWGGQIERDNFHLILHDRRGHDDGVTVTYEKNITGLTAEFNISGVITRIFPFVYIEATDDSPERLITVSGKYIDSPHINDYEVIRTEPVDYSSDDRIDTQDKTDAQIRQQLTNVAKEYFKETDNDKIKSTMDVAFMHLWETEEYKDVKVLELVGMGDTVTINHSKLKVDATAIVNYIKYDCISHVNEEVKLGNVKAGLTDSINKIDSIERKVEQAELNANQAIISANGKNVTFFGPDEPVEGMQKGDLWFKVIDGQYHKTYRYDGIEWQLIIDMDSQEAKAEAQQARDRADEAVNRANQATQQANTAITKAQEGFDKAQDAIDELANLEIGGRNLLLNSNFSNGTEHWNPYSGVTAINENGKSFLYYQSSATGTFAQQQTPILFGEEMVVSFYAKGEGTLRFVYQHQGDGNNNPQAGYNFELTNELKRYIIKYKTPTKNEYPNKTNINTLFYGIAGGEYYITDVKLEKGNRATDWSPAPEDVDQKIDVVANDLDGLSVTVSNNVGEITSIQATAQGLQTSVSNLQGDVTTVTQIATGLQSRVSDAEGNLTVLQQTSTSLAGRLSDAEGNLTTLTATVNGLQTIVSDVQGNVANLTVISNAMQARLSDAEGNINTLTLTSQSMQSTISSLQDDWDNLEIGGRNLIYDSENIPGYFKTYKGSNVVYKKVDMTDEWGFKDAYEATITGGTHNYKLIGRIGGSVGMALDTDYTISIYVKNTGVNELEIFLQGALPNQRQKIVPGESTRVVFTFKRRVAYDWSQLMVTTVNDISDEIKVVLGRIQHEKSNRATDWSPAPEDMATQSQITQLSDAINLRVTKKDLINQINIDTSGILISGKKLILDGDTTVLGTFKVDGSAHIKDSSIGTAQIGTIDAAIANIINLSANNIVGGILSSQNDNMTLNMNTGRLHMQNVDFTLGSGADIEFLDRGNRVYFKDTVGGITRSAGMGVGISTHGYPFSYIGAEGSSSLNTLSEWFTGAIFNSSKAISEGASNSISGFRFQFRNKAVGWDKGMTFDWSGSPAISTLSPATYDYELGTFRRVYGKQSLSFTNYYNERSGWLMETTYAGDGTDITFRGAYGSDYNYQIGESGASNRIRNIYLRNNPNVSSDERLKTDINDLGLGLDFINRIEAKQFRLIPTNADVNQGIMQNKLQYGIIAQQVNSVLADFGVSDSSLITQSDDGYYGAQYEQFIPTLIKSVQELDNKFTDDVNYLKLKVQYLEQKIKQLEGAA